MTDEPQVGDIWHYNSILYGDLYVLLLNKISYSAWNCLDLKKGVNTTSMIGTLLSDNRWTKLA